MCGVWDSDTFVSTELCCACKDYFDFLDPDAIVITDFDTQEILAYTYMWGSAATSLLLLVFKGPLGAYLYKDSEIAPSEQHFLGLSFLIAEFQTTFGFLILTDISDDYVVNNYWWAAKALLLWVNFILVDFVVESSYFGDGDFFF